MKIALAQINPIVGDVAGNLEKVKTAILSAHRDSLVLFPEMVLTGYPLEDLVFSTDLQSDTAQAIASLSSFLRDEAPDRAALVGFLEKPQGESLPGNSVALITASGVERTSSKIALPTYGVFDERRLFSPGEKIMTGVWSGPYGNVRYAVLICEDLWRLDEEAIGQAKAFKPDLLISLNGSPFEENKHEKRVEVMKEALDETGAAYGAYVNMVGGQDDLVFDGGSFVYDKRQCGRVFQAPFFQEDLSTVDVSTLIGFRPLGNYTLEREAMLYRAAVLGLRDYVEKNCFKGVVLGVSGGIDSALVATMAADALGGVRVLGISMPSKYSSEGSIADAEKLMLNLGANFRIVPIGPMVDAYHQGLFLDGVAAENLQARVRGTTLMGVSNQENLLVLTPGNKSELSVGYSTLYGDTVGGFAPLKDLFKVDVYALARWRNKQNEVIPAESIEKPPSAELSPGQLDQDSLPDYDVLDSFLKRAIEERWGRSLLEEAYGKSLTDDILRKIRAAEWKRRQYPVGPKVSKLSFGRERFMPITNKVAMQSFDSKA